MIKSFTEAYKPYPSLITVFIIQYIKEECEDKMINKRWYDKDPILKEALELLRLSPDETKSEAAEFMLQLQEQVAGEVIEHVYDIINTYQGKGNRWYDNDPMMLKAVELLRNAPPKVQRVAALKLLIALEQKTFEGVEI